MRLVVALGGNALLRRGERPESDIQEGHVADAAGSLAALAGHHQLIVTHGNGPQVGLLALESARDPDLARPYPFDVLGAQSQGMIGYWLAQHLQSRLGGRPVVCVVTRTLVDAADPAFARPTKFVGAAYDRRTADALVRTRGWVMRPDGAFWRRVVPSPRPVEILEIEAIARLVDSGAVTVCAGGGGVPVVRAGGRLAGVEAVVDKDHTAARLARDLRADALLLLTDVDGLYAGWGTSEARLLRRVRASELRAMPLPEGSMGPKAAAAADFVEETGGRVGIGHLGEAAAVLAGAAGTAVLPG